MRDDAHVESGDRRRAPSGEEFAFYFDAELSRLTPYHSGGGYFAKAKDRMDRTFDLIKPHVAGRVVVDIGASPFYLLYRARGAGASVCGGVYFAYDEHPLKGVDRIHSRHGHVDIRHANIETDTLPYGDNSVDVLTACEILEHCEMFPELFAREIRRVVKPGGVVCFTVPNVCSIASIAKLVFQKNIYMKYRADPTGRHKHEYTMPQLRDFMSYLGLDVLRAGYFPSPTSDKYWFRPAYRAIAATPVLKRYSPVLFILGRQPDPKPASALEARPDSLFENALSIED